MNAVQILFPSIDRGHAGFSPLNPRHRAHWCVKKKNPQRYRRISFHFVVVSVFNFSGWYGLHTLCFDHAMPLELVHHYTP